MKAGNVAKRSDRTNPCGNLSRRILRPDDFRKHHPQVVSRRITEDGRVAKQCRRIAPTAPPGGRRDRIHGGRNMRERHRRLERNACRDIFVKNARYFCVSVAMGVTTLAEAACFAHVCRHCGQGHSVPSSTLCRPLRRTVERLLEQCCLGRLQ